MKNNLSLILTLLVSAAGSTHSFISAMDGGAAAGAPATPAYATELELINATTEYVEACGAQRRAVMAAIQDYLPTGTPISELTIEQKLVLEYATLSNFMTCIKALSTVYLVLSRNAIRSTLHTDITSLLKINGRDQIYQDMFAFVKNRQEDIVRGLISSSAIASAAAVFNAIESQDDETLLNRLSARIAATVAKIQADKIQAASIADIGTTLAPYEALLEVGKAQMTGNADLIEQALDASDETDTTTESVLLAQAQARIAAENSTERDELLVAFAEEKELYGAIYNADYGSAADSFRACFEVLLCWARGARITEISDLDRSRAETLTSWLNTNYASLLATPDVMEQDFLTQWFGVPRTLAAASSDHK